MGKYDYFERSPVYEPECHDCGDYGFVWRVPDGFNPFAAGGWNTANAMYKVPCGCVSASADDVKDVTG